MSITKNTVDATRYQGVRYQTKCYIWFLDFYGDGKKYIVVKNKTEFDGAWEIVTPSEIGEENFHDYKLIAKMIKAVNKCQTLSKKGKEEMITDIKSLYVNDTEW